MDVALLAPYSCRQCELVNDPRTHPDKCSMCGTPRYKAWLATFVPYNALTEPEQKAARAFLPDVLMAINLVHPDMTCSFTGSPPSLTS